MQPTSDERRTAFSLMRWIIYFCILMICVFSMWYFAGLFKEKTFEEYGVIENLQLVFLFISALSFFIQSFYKTSHRGLSLLLGSVCLTATCREMDAWFDELWFLGWKFSLIFPVLAFGYICRHFNNFRKSMVKFCSSSAFFMMYTVAIIILPIAQCVGHKSFFMDALGPISDPRLVRRLFEESTEYISYILLFLSSIEFYITLIKKTTKNTFRKIK